MILKIAIAPSFVVWLWVSRETRVALAAFVSFFPVVISAAVGFSNIEASGEVTKIGHLVCGYTSIFENRYAPIASRIAARLPRTAESVATPNTKPLVSAPRRRPQRSSAG